MPLSRSSRRAACRIGTSKTAVTWPLSAPWRTSAAVAAPAKGERQTVEQDGFSGAGLTGQHGQAGLERQIKPFNQDDIADRDLGEHGGLDLHVSGAKISFLPAREIQEPPVFAWLETTRLQAA